jgi:NADH-quinone oxidoreductase subunit L
VKALALLVLVSPLAGFLFNVFLGRLLPRRVAGWVGAGSIGVAFLFALGVFALALSGQRLDASYFSWWSGGGLNLDFNLYVDPLSTLMILVITGVGFLIIAYSIGYMAGDPGYRRFFAEMDLFVFSMLLLVLAGNFIWLIVGWGGVGLCSYLLIGFWYERESAVLAARKAFVMNVIGDVGMVFAAFLIFLNLHALDYSSVFSRVHQLPRGGGLITAICLLLLVGAIAKSAQVPLHTWLPDAMEGPTPVSALIHAATMVTAGVYLVARMHLLYDWAPFAASVTAVIGTITLFLAASMAIVQVDIKRILAYSTMSQIGYMFLAVGVGAYAAGMFHFMTHAFFKALLFLAAGNVIHAFHDDQDIRHMGFLRRALPITFWTFLGGVLAISGAPLLSGFFSKDEVIRSALQFGPWTPALGIVALIAAGMTAFYMFRLFFTAFGWEWLPRDERHLHEAPAVQTLPVIILAVLAAVGGYLGVTQFVQPVFGKPQGEAPFGLVVGQALASIAVFLIGAYLAWLLYARRRELAAALQSRFRPLYALVWNLYFFNQLYDRVFVRPGYAIGNFLQRVVEPRVLDGFIDGVVQGVGDLAQDWRQFQTGRVRNYALVTLGGATLIFGYLFFLLLRPTT